MFERANANSSLFYGKFSMTESIFGLKFEHEKPFDIIQTQNSASFRVNLEQKKEFLVIHIHFHPKPSSWPEENSKASS